MRGEFFRTSQSRGIYHTLRLWSSLSPHLVQGEKDARAEDMDGKDRQPVGDDDPKEPSSEAPLEKT